ncbi:MAG: DciA family protein [Ruaniaceae bacterium]|nr:DciA family protein [Ruaniaceae bacterium]
MSEDSAAAFQALERARAMAGRSGGKGKKKWIPPAEAGPGLGNPGSGAKPSRRDPQALGDLAAGLLEERGWEAHLKDADVVTRWAEAVGEAVAAHTVVEAFRDGELVIRASSTAWATQVNLLQVELRRRLAEVLGEDRVTKVVVLGPAGPSWKHGLRSVRGRGPRDTYG